MAPRSLHCSRGLLCLAALSCAALPDAPGEPRPDLPSQESSLHSGHLKGGVPVEYVPAIEAIRSALEEGANDTARRALRALFARGPKGRTLELAKGFERILDGRERLEWVDLHLEATPDPEQGAVFQLELVVSQHGPEALVYRPGGARLWVYQMAIGPHGSGQRGSRRDAIPFPEEILIPLTGQARYPVAQLSLAPPAGILAFSSSLRLEFLPGEFQLEDGSYLPAQAMRQPELELVRLAGAVPNQAIEPEELVRYVQAGKLYLPALLERAVRIPPEQRERALDLLTPLIPSLTGVDMELLVPALRWLTRRDDPGGDPSAWKRYVAARASQKASGSGSRTDGLVLPKS